MLASIDWRQIWYESISISSAFMVVGPSRQRSFIPFVGSFTGEAKYAWQRSEN